MAKLRKLSREQRHKRFRDIFERGPERGKRIRAEYRIHPGPAVWLPLPIDRFEENDSYLLIRWEAITPRTKPKSVEIIVRDYDGALLERKQFPMPEDFRIGSSVCLTSPIGPAI
jgi:hypothetical protein